MTIALLWGETSLRQSATPSTLSVRWQDMKSNRSRDKWTELLIIKIHLHHMEAIWGQRGGTHPTSRHQMSSVVATLSTLQYRDSGRKKRRTRVSRQAIRRDTSTESLNFAANLSFHRLWGNTVKNPFHWEVGNHRESSNLNLVPREPTRC